MEKLEAQLTSRGKPELGAKVTVSWGGKEYESKVVEVKGSWVKVHYVGWNDGYDEWVSTEDEDKPSGIEKENRLGAKDGEGDEAITGVGVLQVEKGMKEKEAEEEELMLDSQSMFEETSLSASCLKIRMLEMKTREIERKKHILDLEKEEKVWELEAEKEKLKATLEESINPKASN